MVSNSSVVGRYLAAFTENLVDPHYVENQAGISAIRRLAGRLVHDRLHLDIRIWPLLDGRAGDRVVGYDGRAEVDPLIASRRCASARPRSPSPCR
jgi:hypothetical protein